MAPFATDTGPAKDSREHRTQDGRSKGTRTGQRGKFLNGGIAGSEVSLEYRTHAVLSP